MMGMNQTPKRQTIEIIAPSSHIGMDAIEGSIARLDQAGYDVVLNPQIHERLHQSAGTTQQKVDAIHAAFANPDSDLILCLVGGNRALNILPHLDYQAIAKTPKPFMGFSDTTCLLNALADQAGIATIHGPTLNRIVKQSDACFAQMLDTLNARPTTIPLDDAVFLKDGEAEGKLYGGNLSIFQAMIGTKYLPDLTGAILFLEDIGDELSRYDRMLSHLKLAGLLRSCAGVIFGDMSEAKDSGRKAFGFTLHDIINEHCAEVSGPVILGAPFGHYGAFYSLPLNCSCFVSRETLKVNP